MTTPADYKSKLSDEQYDVLFNKATELPFSGEHDQQFGEGEYACAACGTVLFDSNKKFDAHCGWPSFYDAKPGAVLFEDDNSLFSKRTEVTCATCGGHLGHIFEGEGLDVPTDQRYCINSLSLTFAPKKT